MAVLVASALGGVSSATADAVLPPPIAVGAVPYAVAFSPDGTKAYVTNSWDNTVTVINATTNTTDTTITVGNRPTGVAFSPDGTKAYVTTTLDNSVAVITAATNTVDTTITVGAGPYAVAFSPDETTAYVTNLSDATVTVIDVDVAPRITSASPTAGAAGTPYSFTVTAIANPAATFAVTAGALPNGLSLDAATEVISGTPTASGSFSFTVTATNTVGTDSQVYAMVLSPVLAATGVTDPMPFILIASGLLLAGVIALSLRGLLRRRSRTSDR